MDKRIEIRIAGFGGQGVILMGIILGKAWALFEGKEAAMTQSFGPEARGGACSAQVVLEEGKVLYPYTTQADILVAMSQEAYNVYASSLKPEGTLLIEEELVKLEKALPALTNVRHSSNPACRGGRPQDGHEYRHARVSHCNHGDCLEGCDEAGGGKLSPQRDGGSKPQGVRDGIHLRARTLRGELNRATSPQSKSGWHFRKETKRQRFAANPSVRGVDTLFSVRLVV